MPRDAPVTTATLPASRPCLLMLAMMPPVPFRWPAERPPRPRWVFPACRCFRSNVRLAICKLAPAGRRCLIAQSAVDTFRARAEEARSEVHELAGWAEVAALALGLAGDA